MGEAGGVCAHLPPTVCPPLADQALRTSYPRSPHRWLSSALLHQSFVHVATNTAMLLGFGWQLESKHGSWRMVVVGVAAALAGNLLRWASRRPGLPAGSSAGLAALRFRPSVPSSLCAAAR